LAWASPATGRFATSPRAAPVRYKRNAQQVARQERERRERVEAELRAALALLLRDATDSPLTPDSGF